MFTGIVETTARILKIESIHDSLRMWLDTNWQDIEVGESIAVNGACLTALNNDNPIAFDLSPETLAKTCLGTFQVGQFVNLERAMPASGRFSGHYVTGHIDTCAKLISCKQIGEYHEMVFSSFGDNIAAQYLITKGSITVNGVSLTINSAVETTISVMVIPHTLKQTTLNALSVGELVNIEFDYVARLVSHQLKAIQQEVVRK